MSKGTKNNRFVVGLALGLMLLGSHLLSAQSLRLTFPQTFPLPFSFPSTQPRSKVKVLSTDTICLLFDWRGNTLLQADGKCEMYRPAKAYWSERDSLYSFSADETEKLTYYDPNNTSQRTTYFLYVPDTTTYRVLTPEEMKQRKICSISQLANRIPEAKTINGAVLSDYFPNVRLIIQQRRRNAYKEYTIVKWESYLHALL